MADALTPDGEAPERAPQPGARQAPPPTPCADERRRARAFATPLAPAAPSRAAAVAAVIGGGLALQGAGDAFARAGHQGPVLWLFFAGLLSIFVPCAWRLLDARAGRSERVRVSVMLGLGLLASYVLRSPLFFDGFDELLHGATLMNLLGMRQLFTPNTALPVSPYYPGLELFTITLKWLTGLPLTVCQILVVVVARVMLVLAIFLVVERASGSARAGGIGVLVYAASPQFYSFAAQYAYETLALALAAVTVHVLLEEIAAFPRERGRRLPLAVGCVITVVVTHHLTGWATVAFLVVWSLALACSGRGPAARTVGNVAGVGLLTAGGWSVLVGGRITAYLGPLFSGAFSGIAAAIGGLHANRVLFADASGAGSPAWQVVVMLGAALAWCVVLLPSLRATVRRATLGSRGTRFLPALIAACYPLTLVARLSSFSSEFGDRASAFAFFGVALVVGAWYAARQGAILRRHERTAAVSVATLCFLGSFLLGSGPSWSYVPGPFLPGADQRSVGSPSIAAALWVSEHLPTGSRVAADRDNSALLADLGHAEPVTAIGGLVNVGPIYFSSVVGNYQLSLVREAKIRYLLADDRLADGLPRFGVYFEPGETPTPERLNSQELHKFASVPGARLIYDNGPIQIYDFSSLLGLPADQPVAPGRGLAGTGADWPVIGLAVVVAARWAWRLRSRRRTGDMDPTCTAVTALGGGVVAGVLFGFLAVPSSLAPRPLGLAVLAVIGVLSWLPSRARPGAERAERATSPSSGSRYLVGAGAVLAVIAAVLAALPARSDWVPPPELAIQHVTSGIPVLEVTLGNAGPVAASIEVLSGSRVVDRLPVARTAAAQTVPVPAGIRLDGDVVVLVVNGRPTVRVQG